MFFVILYTSFFLMFIYYGYKSIINLTRYKYNIQTGQKQYILLSIHHIMFNL